MLGRVLMLVVSPPFPSTGASCGEPRVGPGIFGRRPSGRQHARKAKVKAVERRVLRLDLLLAQIVSRLP
jgi:hypothetical protein